MQQVAKIPVNVLMAGAVHPEQSRVLPFPLLPRFFHRSVFRLLGSINSRGWRDE